MQISTSEFYSINIQTMDNQQNELTALQQEVSTGIAISEPSDNPLGDADAVQLSEASATLSQFTSNQNSAQTSLQLEDTTLSNVTGTLNSINALIEEAQGGTLSASDQAAVGKQLQGLRDQLLGTANTTDGSGNFVFAGFQAGTQPFTNNPAGGVTFNGDSGTNLVQVSSTSQIATNDSGASVFLSVLPGAQQVAQGSSANTGTGVIGAVNTTDATAATNNDQFTITFGGTAAAPTFTVTDNTAAPPTTTAPAAFTAGAAIPLGNGLSVSVKGTPAAGDTFTVAPANQSGTDIFATIDNVIAALQTSISNNPAAAANLTNQLDAATTQINNSLNNVETIQASVGGREQELTAVQASTQTQSLQVTTTLTNTVDISPTNAISQLEEVQNALSASQKSFAVVQGLSLFQDINP